MMIIYEEGEQFNVPPKWLAEHDKQVRDEVISEILKWIYLNRECPNPFIHYNSLKHKLERMKGEQNELGN